MNWKTDFDQQRIDRADPNPWLALYLDQSLPIHDPAKRALLRGYNSRSRRLMLPLIRPVARLCIILVKLARMVVPGHWASTWALHQSIYWGLRLFVRRDSNYLILRHFHIGTELLRFIADNAGVNIESTVTLRPRTLEDLKDDTFLIHDLNIYNFLLELNSKLQAEGRSLRAPARLNYDAISDGEFDLDPGPDGPCNVIDLQTAIESYVPMYSLLLTDHDFWRAANSLQLDETIALYIATLIGDPLPVGLVSNRHPMVPLITLGSGFRLMLHGLDAELMHAYLRESKRAQARAEQPM